MSAAAKVLERLANPRQSGTGRWIARCPAHEDRSPSLSVREMEDGRVLLHCFAGCEVGDVLAAIGLSLSDLFAKPIAHHLPPVKGGFTARELLELNAHESFIAVDLSLAIAALPSRPDLIVVDTFSKFSAGIDENSNSEVSRYLSELSLELRDHFGATVLLIANSGHGESKRPRGASALMANPDCEYIVNRPDAQEMDISITRDRFKDSPAFEALGYRAAIIDLDGALATVIIAARNAVAARRKHKAEFASSTTT